MDRDYVIGSIAALISGTTTPNRPRPNKRAGTPVKHPLSPNVTPKSELVDDRSIFLSPSVQKKKALLKKSPKRIFQNTDLDGTDENDPKNITSPKADKVKKHLKQELESSESVPNISVEESPKKKKKKSLLEAEQINTESKKSPKIKLQNEDTEHLKAESNLAATPGDIENKKKKKKKNKSLDVEEIEMEVQNKSPMKKKIQTVSESKVSDDQNVQKITKKNKKNKSSLNPEETKTAIQIESPKNNKKQTISESKVIDDANLLQTQKKKKNNLTLNLEETEKEIQIKSPKKKKNNSTLESQDQNQETKTKKNKKPIVVNPNAITQDDTDSEHESDNEIQSETEEQNNEVLKNEDPDQSSDEEEEKTKSPKKTETKDVESTPIDTGELKRTLFVGNVPFSTKCKKEIKKIFSKYGTIDSVRIRTVPVKDGRVTPKLAVIRNELHPERTTVNVYVKYREAYAVDQALKENNTVLNNHHLRVTRSDSTGDAHDPRCAIFVGNLPFALEDEALRAKFDKCGEIESVRIVRDRKTNAGKGFGYVNFASKDGVELALLLSEEDLTIKNRILRVKRCTQFTGKPKSQTGQVHREFKGGKQDERGTGAFRRILKKRTFEESAAINQAGPPNKRHKPNLNQPQREKKSRKEFVGMTSEKKKKQKFSKNMKKKKAISEILTKV